MNLRFSRFPPVRIAVAGLIAGAVLAAAAFAWWNPAAWSLVADLPSRLGLREGEEAAPVDDHDHDHDHAQDEAPSIALSDAALANIGYVPYAIEKRNYEQITSIPAMIVERPGKSELLVTAPFTGIVTEIFVGQGVAVAEDDALFEVRLTHEDLVNAQSDLLKTAESLAVVEREIARLKGLAEGIVAGNRLLEQQYEKQKLEAALLADRQTLNLHGLSPERVDEILNTGQLLERLTIRAPEHVHGDEACPEDHLFTVSDLPVRKGQLVEIGAQLCTLSDHCQLYVEGQAFEDDADELREAMREGRALAGRLQNGDVIEGLKIRFLADRIEPTSRTFHFYAGLPNEIALDRTQGSDRFLEWKFKPGQRLELRVPTEVLPDRYVVPTEAIVEEGAERFVFRQNGDKFERKSVHVERRDGEWAALAADGSLFPGDVVAGRGAYQMHLAIKNASGGAVDPHAGHNH